MQIGMRDHRQKMIFHFMKTHEWLDKSHSIWLSVPTYHNLTPKNKPYEEVSEWDEKEMKEMSRNLLGVVTQSLWGGTPAQHPIINRELEFTPALLEFYICAGYKSRDDATWSYMEDAYHRFRTFKDVFLLWWAGKKEKAKANTLRMELVKKRKVDEETTADSWMASKKRCEMNTWRDYVRHEIDISQVLDATLNFLKIHWISHWAEQICRCGALHQYASERQEQAHKMNLKNGWNASNHNLIYLQQVITFPRCTLFFQIRELNLEALTQRWENRAAACKVFPSGADLASPLRSQSYGKPKFMWPQKCRDGKHPQSIIKDFRALHDNTQDAMHWLAIYSGMRDFIKHKSRNKMYLSDEQLHPMAHCIYDGIKMEGEGLDGEQISLKCRCTGSHSWLGRDRQNDWLSLKQCLGFGYCTVNRRLPWQLQRLFIINLQNNDGAYVEYWLALVHTTMPENSGNLDPVSKFV